MPLSTHIFNQNIYLKYKNTSRCKKVAYLNTYNNHVQRTVALLKDLFSCDVVVSQRIARVTVLSTTINNSTINMIILSFSKFLIIISIFIVND